MAVTPSNMIPLGTQAPDFKLLDVVSQQMRGLEQLKGKKGTVVMFICNHCPFVKHIQTALIATATEYLRKEIAFIAINSNDTTAYPDDAPEKMQEVAETLNYPFPYLFDETQATAKAYQAACTPDFYVFDADLKCVYRGQFDESRPGNSIPPTGNDLRNTLDHLLQNTPIDPNQKPSIGCNIKWKK